MLREKFKTLNTYIGKEEKPQIYGVRPPPPHTHKNLEKKSKINLNKQKEGN